MVVTLLISHPAFTCIPDKVMTFISAVTISHSFSDYYIFTDLSPSSSSEFMGQVWFER
jgi:hypothetical protein